MSKIRILPEQLANQIAAGEVVERPASVVKELVENSLDAGATRIEVEIEGGGTRLIRVIDNGEGMEEDDVLLSLERHGTSKIQTDQDLTAIQTLGFRGEAIPSIGSVSRMTITSRRIENELGTKAEIKFGKLIKVHEAGCSIGTIFEIANLFGNTPARKKFLRTVRTELNHIDEVLKNYSLANPDITFSLSVNGKQTFYLDRNHSLEQRLGKIMNYTGRYIKVGDEKNHSSPKHVFGYLTPPEKLPTGPARLRLFVNGRAIKDRMLTHAVAEGLRGFLMKGKNPAGLLHVVLPADEVDVNVHPAKHEVRFRNSRDVHFLVSKAVKEAMNQEQRILQSSLFGKEPATTAVPLEREQPVANPFEPRVDETHEVPASTLQTRESQHPDPVKPTSFSPPQANKPIAPDTTQPVVKEDTPAVPYISKEPERLAIPQTVFPPGTSSPKTAVKQPTLLTEPTEHHGLNVIGQFSDLYIFCQNREGLLVIDQHAAHERLLYEELREQYLSGKIPSQNLLFPETIELTLFQTQLVERHLDELEHMGFALREFGGNSFIISAVPAFAAKMSPGELLTDVLEQFGSESSRRETGDRIDTILSTIACKAAVKSGTALSHKEIDALLNKMAKANLFSHCPHGRPVVRQFSQNDIKKWFHRT